MKFHFLPSLLLGFLVSCQPATPTKTASDFSETASSELKGGIPGKPKQNTAPVVNAGADISKLDSDNSGAELITLAGSAMDAQNNITSYRLLRNGSLLLSDVSSSVFRSTLKLSVGTHTIVMEAFDSTGLKGTDSVTLVVMAAEVAAPSPDPVAGSSYPFYFPLSGLRAPVDVRRISCAYSNAAGELRDMSNQPVIQWNAPAFEGIEFIYEAPCTYKDMSPSGVRSWIWTDGSQVIHRTSQRGAKAVFTGAGEWHRLSVNPGTIQGRFHTEIIDLELRFTGNIQVMGTLHFEVYPNADTGQLATLVVRDSVFEGGKNALFIPGGASISYFENSTFARSVGTNVDQEHVTYINGVISTHFKNVRFYGDNAVNGYGGHILKNKAAIRILENVTLDNGGGVADNSVMPLADFSSFGYTWSDNLKLIRRLPQVGTLRDSVVDMRTDRYFHPDGPVKLPFFTSQGEAMPELPPGCNSPQDNVNEVYWHVFNNTTLQSDITDKSVFRMNGVVDSSYSGIFGQSSFEEIMGNLSRNRAMLLTNGTIHSAMNVTDDGYYWLKPSYPTYHCENLLSKGPNLSGITASRDNFLKHAFKRMRDANPAMPALPGI